MSENNFMKFEGSIYMGDASLPGDPPRQLSNIWVRKDAIEAIFEFTATSQYYLSYRGYAVLHINSGKQIVVKGYATLIKQRLSDSDMEDA